MNELTQNGAYHERAANDNSRIVVLTKNFHFGLIILDNIETADVYPVWWRVFGQPQGCVGGPPSERKAHRNAM
jgi:hypothetical protein